MGPFSDPRLGGCTTATSVRTARLLFVNPEKVYPSRLSAGNQAARDPTLCAMRAEGSLSQFANRNFPCPLWIQAVLGSLSACQVGMDVISIRLI